MRVLVAWGSKRGVTEGIARMLADDLRRRGTAVTVHAVAAPIVFGVIARRYFGVRGARPPFGVAAAFTAIVAALDLGLVAGIAQQRLAMPKSIMGFWLPLTLIFVVTWAIGVVQTMTVRRDRFAASRS